MSCGLSAAALPTEAKLRGAMLIEVNPGRVFNSFK